MVSGVIGPMAGRQGIEGGDGRGRCHEQIVALHELAHVRTQRAAAQVQVLDLQGAVATTEFCLGLKIRIADRLLLRAQATPYRERTRETTGRS